MKPFIQLILKDLQKPGGKQWRGQYFKQPWSLRRGERPLEALLDGITCFECTEIAPLGVLWQEHLIKVVGTGVPHTTFLKMPVEPKIWIETNYGMKFGYLIESCEGEQGRTLAINYFAGPLTRAHHWLRLPFEDWFSIHTRQWHTYVLTDDLDAAGANPPGRSSGGQALSYLALINSPTKARIDQQALPSGLRRVLSGGRAALTLDPIWRVARLVLEPAREAVE